MSRRIAEISIKVLLTDLWISKHLKLVMMDDFNWCSIWLLLRYNHFFIFVFMITSICYKPGPVEVFCCDRNEIGVRKTPGPKYNDKYVDDLSTGNHKSLRESLILTTLHLRHQNKPFDPVRCLDLKRGTVVNFDTFYIGFRNFSRSMAHRCRSLSQNFTRTQFFLEKVFQFLCLSADQICNFLFQNHPT